MCFYNQSHFACGDITRNLRHRCDRADPQESFCNSETASEIIHLQNKCDRCNRISTYRRSQQREWERIDVLESKEQVDGEAMQRSIDIINQLQGKILALELKRRNQPFTVSEDDVENHEKASLGPVVESADMLAPDTASAVTKFDNSAPLNELEDEYDEDDVSSRALPPTARATGAQQVAESKAPRRSKDNETPVPKTSQGKLAINVIDILEQWFEENSAHPYTLPDEKKKLCSRTGLSAIQVRTIRPPCR